MAGALDHRTQSPLRTVWIAVYSATFQYNSLVSGLRKLWDFNLEEFKNSIDVTLVNVSSKAHLVRDIVKMCEKAYVQSNLMSLGQDIWYNV